MGPGLSFLGLWVGACLIWKVVVLYLLIFDLVSRDLEMLLEKWPFELGSAPCGVGSPDDF